MERSKIKISRADAISFIGSEGYFTIDKRLLFLFDPTTSLFLVNLIDFYKYLKDFQILGEDDEWFFCSYDYQRTMIGPLSDHILRAAKNRLIEEKILKSKIVGMPKVEFYYIDFIRLFARLRATCTRDEKIASQEIKKLHLKRLKNLTYNRTNKEQTNIKGTINGSLSDPEKKPIKIPIEKKNAPFLYLAESLSEIIQTKKNIRHTPKQIQDWAGEIRKLNETNKVSKERIEHALSWYACNIGGAFIPEIQSGASLREKFEKLENAIKRAEIDQARNTPKNKPRNGYREVGKVYRDADATV